MKLLLLTRKSWTSVRWIMKAVFKIFLVLFMIESVIFNCIGIYIIFSLRQSVSDILNAPGVTFFDKLAVSPIFKEAVSLGKEGGFVALLQHTLGRVYVESINDQHCGVSKQVTDKSSKYTNKLHGIGAVGVDVSGAGEALFIYQRLKLLKASVQFKHLVVDIGANDGLLSSNSFNFIQWGWNAILVEPQAYQLKLAQRNTMRIMHHEDQVKYLQAVIDDHDGYIPFKLSSDPVSMESHVVRGNVDQIQGTVTQMQCFSVKTFTDKFQIPKYFGILSLDAEGSNSKILHQWLKLGYRPAYIIYEELHDPENFYTTKGRLTNAGYKYLIKKGWNHIFEYTFPQSNTSSIPTGA